MSIEGITTTVSRSAMPEKVQDVTDKAAENKHLATTQVVQKQAEKNLKKVREMDKANLSSRINEKEEKERKHKNSSQNDTNKNKARKGHLDLNA